MLNLRELILVLKENDYRSFVKSFKKNKAEKFLLLTQCLRNARLTEEEIIRKLDLNANAYYILKFRVYQKIKEFLSAQLSYSKTDLYVNISLIPNLLYNTSKKEARLVLEQLEEDLLQNDMSYALAIVYSALKKVHAGSPQFFHYSRQYNKNMAYIATIDKAEDLLVNFNKTLGDYFISRNSELLDLLLFIKKEMSATSKLYNSHHLNMYKLILDISLAVTIPEIEQEEDEPIEDMLEAMNNIFTTFPNNPVYQHLDKVYQYFAFEYYHGIGIHKKAASFLETISETLPSFLLYNFCVFPSKILISKLEHYRALKKQHLLFEENKELIKEYDADPENEANFINYFKYLAVSAFYSKKYVDAIDYLNTIVTRLSIRNYIHADIEIKLLLVICNSLIEKYSVAAVSLKSVIRKTSEMEGNEYEHVKILCKLLKMQSYSTMQPFDKMLEMRDAFLHLNKGNYRVLEWIDFSDDLILSLGKPPGAEEW